MNWQANLERNESSSKENCQLFPASFQTCLYLWLYVTNGRRVDLSQRGGQEFHVRSRQEEQIGQKIRPRDPYLKRSPRRLKKTMLETMTDTRSKSIAIAFAVGDRLCAITISGAAFSPSRSCHAKSACPNGK